MPMAVIFQFIPFYHVLHDLFSVHTEVCVWVLIGLYVMLAWIGERRSNGTDPKSTGMVECIHMYNVPISRFDGTVLDVCVLGVFPTCTFKQGA